MLQAAPLSPAIAASLEKWHAMVASGNLEGLPDLLHPQASFRSPMAHKPYASAQAVALIVTTVIGVFTQFKYHRQFVNEDGMSVVLEFSAMVGDKAIKGIDMVRFDDDGLIVDFEVMVRPMSGLQALGAEMGARLGALLPAFKTANT
ncbi:nuclear transport factor 2 family protein [Rhodoferax aquaticus]|uniref:Nuclear transport factor 2 family protein n=1 Tax=Rhodoferax aquaticus TaxID=2527691 RepID=A0A515ELA0_9BURK|nr:nuclear transport factor 2 family protein [Rhodoferax aquaticus]QDL53443.1 nuclear transport factor 2 family protein [Rhodoferax aquaticus]